MSGFLKKGRYLIYYYFVITGFSFICILFPTIKSFYNFLYTKNDPKLFSFSISIFIILISILICLSAPSLLKDLLNVKIILSIIGIYFYSFLCTSIPFYFLIFLSILIFYNTFSLLLQIANDLGFESDTTNTINYIKTSEQSLRNLCIPQGGRYILGKSTPHTFEFLANYEKTLVFRELERDFINFGNISIQNLFDSGEFLTVSQVFSQLSKTKKDLKTSLKPIIDKIRIDSVNKENDVEKYSNSIAEKADFNLYLNKTLAFCDNNSDSDDLLSFIKNYYNLVNSYLQLSKAQKSVEKINI